MPLARLVHATCTPTEQYVARSASLTQLTVRGNTDKVLELARVFKTERSKLYHAAPTKPQAAPKPALHNLDDSELNNHSISARARL